MQISTGSAFWENKGYSREVLKVCLYEECIIIFQYTEKKLNEVSSFILSHRINYKKRI